MKQALLLLFLSVTMTAGLAVADSSSQGSGADARSVELTGVIKSGMMAIGGETTGTLLVTDDGESYELRIRPDLIEALGGKKAKISGTLVEKQGVEIPVRRIVTVTSASPVE